MSPFKRALTPDALQAAVISPYGGKLSDFSRIGWVRPLQMAVVSSGTNSGPVLKTVSTITGAPVPGVPIAWTVLLGGGTVSPANTVTDANGSSKTIWTPGPLPGMNELKATASNPLPGWPGRPGDWGELQFQLDRPAPPPPVVYHAVFLKPIGIGTTGSTSWWSTATPSVAVCRLSNGACVQTVIAYPNTSKNVVTRSYQATWTPAAALPLGMYRIIVTNHSQAMGSVDLEAVATPSDLTLAKFQVGKPLVIKFSLEP
jgi:hypothetical protein